jgi:hypothetical protein
VGRRWVRSGAVTVALASLALSASGCASGSSGNAGADDVDGAPVVAAAITRPGGELPDGFTVPPGTVLLGAVQRTGIRSTLNGEPVPERGWNALLLVNGDPYDVLEDVRAQAAHNGMPASLMPTGCTTYPDVVECRVDAHSPGFVQHPARGAGLSALVTRGPGGSSRPPMSHLRLSYSEVQPSEARKPVAAPPAVDRTEPVRLFPDDWPAPLQPGDRFGSISGETWVVEDGTRLVGPPSYTAVCATGGFDAVFEVTGDAERVVERYARQFAHAGFSGVRAPFGDDVPGTGPSARYTQPGGGEVSAVTVDGSGGRRFLWLSRCND